MKAVKMKNKTLGSRVDGNKIIYKDDDVSIAKVFVGSFMDGHMYDMTEGLAWNDEQYQNGELANLSLNQIAEQLSDSGRIITVVVLSALSGDVYQYGNYGDYWIYWGTLHGYA